MCAAVAKSRAHGNITIRADRDLIDELERIARKRERSTAGEIRAALREHVVRVRVEEAAA
jgi:predicted transcriptional regulator